MKIEEKYPHHDESTLIIDGQDVRQEILMSIHEAQKTIRIRMFMWKNDSAGKMILIALRQKTKVYPSIQIFIEKDAFGSWVYNLQNFISFGKLKGDIFSGDLGRELLKNRDHVHLSYIGSWFPFGLRYLKQNDHSKVFIFDEFTEGSKALIGGMNIADEYLNSHNSTGSYTMGWHDYMVKLTGKLADSITVGKSKKAKKLIQRKFQRGVEILMTLKNRHIMRKKILKELSRAKSSIIIEHGYLTDVAVLRLLRRLSYRDIHIQVIIPNASDGVWHANMHSINRLLRPSLTHARPMSNIEVYLYPWMIHAKVALIDQSIAIIGSANFTYGSFDFLHETNVIFKDKGQVIESLSIQLQKDISLSKRISFGNIPKYSRLLAWIQAIFI